MSFGETLYYMMYEILSPYGMEDLAHVRQAWDLFPFGDLSEAEQNDIQMAFENKLKEIVAYLSETGRTIADLMENREWKSGNEDFIGLLSQLARSIGSTYDSTAGALVFSADGRTINGVFPFVAVKAAAVATDMKYLINGSTLSAIADAIRAKTGETGTIVANDFATKIASIPSGGYEPGQVEFKSGPDITIPDGQYTLSTLMQAYGYDDIRGAIINAGSQSEILPEPGNTAFFENLTNGELDGVTFENCRFGGWNAPVVLRNVNAKIKFKNCIFEMGQSTSMVEHSFVDLVLDSCSFF